MFSSSDDMKYGDTQEINPPAFLAVTKDVHPRWIGDNPGNECIQLASCTDL